MISIIVPVYNSEDCLHVCLNSILKQTYSDFEVICFNDNSTDSSKEILDYFTLKDSRIKYIHNETKKGEDYCKNRGLEIAKGKYITFLNSNEWLYSSTLEILVRHAENKNLDLIFYNNENNNLNKNEFEVFNPFDLDNNEIEILDKEWSKFYLKSILKNNDFINTIQSIKRISLINGAFKSSQMLNNDNQSMETIKRQQLFDVKDKINNIELSVQKQGNQIKEFINCQKDLNKDFQNSTRVFMDYYNEFRNYFFNNQEENLKKYFNTEDLFKLCYFNNFKFISYSPAENRILIKTDDGIIIGSNNRFYTIKEVIGFNGYSIPQLYDFNEFIVFDVGMNRAYASLWFAKFNNCKWVYGFEIDPETYNKAISNINLNPHLSSKITTYNFGLSNEDGEVDLYYVDGCDGVNTMFTDVADLQSELKDKSKVKTKKVQVKKTSEILSKIIKDENITSNIVLKIDTEGAEYNIISKIDVLLGEGHLFEREHYCDKLKEIGFRQIEMQINQVTYQFAFVKEDYYNVWPLKE